MKIKNVLIACCLAACSNLHAYQWRVQDDEDWIKYSNLTASDPQLCVDELSAIIPNITNSKDAAIFLLATAAFAVEYRSGVFAGEPFRHLDAYRGLLGSDKTYYESTGAIAVYTREYAEKGMVTGLAYLADSAEEGGVVKNDTLLDFATCAIVMGNYTAAKQFLDAVVGTENGKRYTTLKATYLINLSPADGVKYFFDNYADTYPERVYEKVDLSNIPDPAGFLKNIMLRTKVDDSTVDFLKKIKAQYGLIK